MPNTHKPIHPTIRSRYTVDDIRTALESPESTPAEVADALRKKPFLILRRLAEAQAPEVLRLYLNQEYVSTEICSRFLIEENPQDQAVRLVLMQKLLREKMPKSVSQSDAAPVQIQADTFPADEDIRPSADPTITVEHQENDPYKNTREHILRLSTREPFLRRILHEMDIFSTDDSVDFGTDGTAFYVSKNPYIDRPDYTDICHMVIHCLFDHVHPPAGANAPVWNTACDLAAEYLQDEIFPADLQRSSNPRNTLDHRTVCRMDDHKTGYIHSISDLPIPDQLYPGDAAALYSWLRHLPPADCRSIEEQTAETLHRDDHSFWYPSTDSNTSPEADTFTEGDGSGGDGTFNDDGDNTKGNNSAGAHRRETSGRGHISRRAEDMRQLWQEARNMHSVSRRKPRRGTAPGSRRERLLLHERGQYDFRRYLRRYSVMQEELQVDPDNFDYIYYTLGLSLYGSMPLLEPLEYTEAFKVEQLVIAIDTSGSCDTATVQRFLAEVQNILTRHDHFFRRMEVHIIQCDSAVQEHKIIHSVEEWTDYIQNIVIQGRGGTDFIPVFRYVEKLQQDGQAQRLKGLIYFTDGDGIYPQAQTPYETAFVFSDWAFLKYRVPEWVVKLCLEQ